MHSCKCLDSELFWQRLGLRYTYIHFKSNLSAWNNTRIGCAEWVRLHLLREGSMSLIIHYSAVCIYSMYVCMYICTYVCTVMLYVCMYVCIWPRFEVFECMYVCVFVLLFFFLRILYVYTACMYVCMYLIINCECMYVCMYVRMYDNCMYVWMTRWWKAPRK